MAEKNKKEEEKKELTEKEKKIKELEEELSSILKEQEQRQNNPWVIYFNLGLHKNFFVHLILMFLVNIFSLSAIIGLTGYGEITNIVYYIFSIVLFTLIETGLKITTFSFFSKQVVKSFGAINALYLIPLYYVMISLVGQVVFGGFFKYAVVYICFIVLRIFLMHYIKRINFRR